MIHPESILLQATVYIFFAIVNAEVSFNWSMLLLQGWLIVDCCKQGFL